MQASSLVQGKAESLRKAGYNWGPRISGWSEAMISFRKPKDRNDWFAVLLGVPLVVFSALPLLQGVQSLFWPRAAGVITYSSPKRAIRTYRLELRYRYSYGGREYMGDTYRFQFLVNRERMRSSEVDSIQARYPVGEAVQVAVNLNKPSQSVIQPGPDPTDLIWLAFGALLLLVGTGMRRAEAKQPEVQSSPPSVQVPRYRTAKWLLAIGSLLLLYGLSELHKGWSSLSWPTVKGKVLYSRAHRGPQSHTWLWYEYSVGNTRYVCDKYRNGGNATPFDDVAIAAARRYAAGRAVTVYYKPSDPSEALLEPGVWYGNFVIPGIGLLVLGVAWVAKKYAEAMHRLRVSHPK